eukprot:jgi/Tetstr1/445460/TSEL_033239.t1
MVAALSSLCGSLGDELVGLCRQGTRRKMSGIRRVRVDCGPSQAFSVAWLVAGGDVAGGEDNAAAVDGEAGEAGEDASEEGEEVHSGEGAGEGDGMAPAVSGEEEDRHQLAMDNASGRLAPQLRAWLEAARQMLQGDLPRVQRQRVVTRRAMRMIGQPHLPAHKKLAAAYLEEACPVQVAAMEVMGRLPAASDAVRRQAPQSGAGAAGPGVRAKAAAASFVPGDWQSWSGLAAPGLTGSGAELMLDDILDLQEALARHVEQLRPRASTWGKPGGLYRLRESVRTVAELVERANAKLEGLGMLMQ